MAERSNDYSGTYGQTFRDRSLEIDCEPIPDPGRSISNSALHSTKTTYSTEDKDSAIVKYYREVPPEVKIWPHDVMIVYCEADKDKVLPYYKNLTGLHMKGSKVRAILYDDASIVFSDMFSLIMDLCTFLLLYVTNCFCDNKDGWKKFSDEKWLQDFIYNKRCIVVNSATQKLPMGLNALRSLNYGSDFANYERQVIGILEPTLKSRLAKEQQTRNKIWTWIQQNILERQTAKSYNRDEFRSHESDRKVQVVHPQVRANAHAETRGAHAESRYASRERVIVESRDFSIPSIDSGLGSSLSGEFQDLKQDGFPGSYHTGSLGSEVGRNFTGPTERGRQGTSRERVEVHHHHYHPKEPKTEINIYGDTAITYTGRSRKKERRGIPKCTTAVKPDAPQKAEKRGNIQSQIPQEAFRSESNVQSRQHTEHESIQVLGHRRQQNVCVGDGNILKDSSGTPKKQNMDIKKSNNTKGSVDDMDKLLDELLTFKGEINTDADLRTENKRSRSCADADVTMVKTYVSSDESSSSSDEEIVNNF